MWRGGTERGVEGQVADLVPLGQAGLDVAAALAVGLGARAATGLLARQPVELGIQTARGKFLGAGDLLPALPPVPFLRRVGDRLRPGLTLVDISAV